MSFYPPLLSSVTKTESMKAPSGNNKDRASKEPMTEHIGIGGFLGVGERHAAVSFSALQMSRDANNNARISVNVTKEQLKASPEWTWRPASAN